MKLNLGCGDDIRPGYVNVDFRKLQGVSQVVDLSVFPWPFKDESAEEILMLDFLEHFPYRDTSRLLLECYRTLTAEGTVVVQVPDGGHLTQALGQLGEYLCNRCGYKVDDRVIAGRCPQCSQTLSEISEAAMRRLYGGQDYPGNFHQTCFTEPSLVRKAEEAGLTLVGFEEIEHQYKNWNFKARFKRGDIW